MRNERCFTKMRNEEARAAGRQKTYSINMETSASLILDSRTCEAVARIKVHFLHAVGKHDLVDSTCGWEGEEGKRRK